MQSAAQDRVNNEGSPSRNNFKLRSLKNRQSDNAKDSDSKRQIVIIFQELAEKFQPQAPPYPQQDKQNKESKLEATLNEIIQYLISKSPLNEGLSESIQRLKQQERKKNASIILNPLPKQKINCRVCNQEIDDYLKHIEKPCHLEKYNKSQFKGQLNNLIEMDNHNYQKIRVLKLSQNQQIELRSKPSKKRHTEATASTIRRIISLSAIQQSFEQIQALNNKILSEIRYEPQS